MSSPVSLVANASRTRPAPALVFVAAVLGLFLLARFPGHPDELTLAHLARWPLEVPLAVLLLLILPSTRTRAFRALLVVSLAALLLLRLADIGSYLAFGRAFSPLAELHLIGQGWSLASRTVGRAEAGVTVVFSLLVLALVTALLYRGLGAAAELTPTVRRQLLRATLVVLLAGAVAWGAQRIGGTDLGVRADVGAEFVERIERLRRTVADQAEFATALDADPLDSRPPPTFAALEGLDVIVLFVESYGRSYLDAPRFAADTRAGLERIGAELTRAGLSARSGWADSPIRGGRSWLAQATLASGLPLTNQARFDRLLGSERRSLHRLFGDAGWRTAAVLPIVDGEWVEGAWYGVERFVDGPSLGYAGLDFGYVPMPDQYTLAAFERELRGGAEEPLFATVGLLGSHAPWTPLALPVPWEGIGDGALFDGSHRFGGPLSWSDPEPVRTMYARSLELTLTRIGEYLVRHAAGGLFVVVGDHQPAHVIAGWAPNAHVPIHLVATDPVLLERLPATHFSAGMVPDTDAPALPLAALRELLASVFETAPPGAVVATATERAPDTAAGGSDDPGVALPR